jgi:hypothetical protein
MEASFRKNTPPYGMNTEGTQPIGMVMRALSVTRWLKKLLLRKKLEEIVAMPATLYFPTGIVAQLNEICEESGYTPGQLVVRALKGQIYHWDRFYQYVTTPPEKPEDFSWPEDPMFCLACAATVHFLQSFTRSVYDPIAFKQQREHAPAEWSYSSFEEPDEDDPADWWKTLS